MTAETPQDPRGPAASLGRTPLSIGGVIEVTTAVLRLRWASALLLAALFVIPGALATVAFGMRFSSVADELRPALSGGILEGRGGVTPAQAERLVGALVAYVGASVVAGLLGSIGAVAFSRLLAREVGVGSGDLADAVRTSLRRAPSVVAFSAVTSAIIVALGIAALVVVLVLLGLQPAGSRGGPAVFAALIVGVALAVAVVYLTLRWAPAYAVMALEEAGWRRAMARSWRLSADRVWRILAIVALGVLVSLLLAAVVTQLLGIVIVDGLAPRLGFDPAGAGSLIVVLGTVLAAPITPVLVAVLSIDLRARKAEVAVPGSPTSPGEPPQA